MVRSVSSLIDLMQDDTDEQPPAGGADTQQADPGGRDDEGEQGGFARLVLLQCRVQAAAYGAEQGQPGDAGDQCRRKGGEQGGHACPEATGQQIEAASPDGGGPATAGIGIHVLAHADGGRNGRQIEGVAAEGGQQQAGQAGPGDQG